MSNLEQLGLYLQFDIQLGLIDATVLENNILNRIPRLIGCSFYFYSQMYIREQTTVPSEENLQQPLIHFPKDAIISYLDYFPKGKQYGYHLYSLPCRSPHYDDVSNRFPGGLFEYVRSAVLHDEHPFEHGFFLRICQSFPLLENLTLINNEPQNRKQLTNENRDLPVIYYSFLQILRLVNVHDDYIEQFLLNMKTSFQQKIALTIKYESLQRVTENFTRNSMRVNCSKIHVLDLLGKPCVNSLQEYFPNVKLFQ